MIVSVVGAGKMGLPLACHFAARGARVHACDVNAELVAAINSGTCPIDEPGVPELLAAAVAGGALTATTDTGTAVAESDAVVVIVPALLTDDLHADLSILESVTRQIAAAMQPGLLVSYETTVPVGTTRNRFLPILEEGGRRVGEDFHLAFSPERVRSGHVLEFLDVTPKVVGGADADSEKRAEAFYREMLGAPVLPAGSLETAEFVKLAGMIYRDVNIALANELARYADAVGVDYLDAAPIANTNGVAHLLTPGIGVGGHCTPVYPYFLIHDAREQSIGSALATAARRVNDGQAGYVVAGLDRALGGLTGTRILILGLAFRPGVKEHLFSPAFLVRDELSRRGADVLLHDPLYDDAEIRAHGFTPAPLDAPGVDAVVLVTAHAQYADLDPAVLAGRGVRAVADGRGAWAPEVVTAAGMRYVGVGRGAAPSPAGTDPSARRSST